MKKTMKLIGLVAMAALLFSCEKKAATIDVPGNEPTQSGTDLSGLDPDIYLLGFGARFENEASGTKVSITFEDDKATPAFEDGDVVLVYCDGTTGNYTFDEDEGLFVPASESDAIAAGSNAVYVYYPASEFSVDGSDVTFTMPEAVTAGSAEDLGDKVPMAGIIPTGSASDPVVTFKNLGSILRVSFNSSAADGETITAVELNVTGANITGSGTVSWSSDTPAVGSLDGGMTVSVTTDAGHLTSESYKDFYFFLPASGSLTAMTIKAVYGKTDGSNAYSPYESISRTSTLTLARNKIYKVQKSLKGFFSGGDGSESYPYVINSEADFDKIYTYWADATENGVLGYNGTDTFFGHANYKQTVETIDKDGETYNVIGTTDKPFYGVYDGNNNTIANVSIGDGTNYGLFGCTNGAVIKNWTANSISVDGTSYNRGAFIGLMQGGEVNNCDVTGTSKISGDQAGIGGIVGRILTTAGTITGCDSSADVENSSNGNNATGGIVGLVYVSDCTVSSCTTSGNVTGSSCSYIGGIVGRFYQAGSLTGCSTTSEKTVTGNNYVGGIAGQIVASVTVSGCTNNASVTGESSVGGIVGLMTSGSIEGETSQNTGTVKATGKDSSTNFAAVGGIAGQMAAGTVSKANNTGSVTAEAGNGCGGAVGAMTGGKVTGYGRTAGAVSGIHHVGGIVGVLQGGKVENSFNGVDVTATGNGVGGIVGTVQGGSVSTCYSKTGITIQGTYRVGGIVGYLSSGQGAAVVINCAAKSNVYATKADASTTEGYAGGIVGRLHSTSGKNAVLANCVALAAKVYGVVNNIPCGGVVGMISGTQANSIVDNCYSQANTNAYIGYSTDDGTTVKNCTSYSGGIYGHFYAGYVMDCYYTTANPGTGKKASSNTALYGSGIKQITNAAKNGTESFSITKTGAYYNSTFYQPDVSQSGLLYAILNIGTQAITKNGDNYLLSSSENQTYASSYGTETCSNWLAYGSSSTYKVAYPKTLYDLGANYRP